MTAKDALRLLEWFVIMYREVGGYSGQDKYIVKHILLPMLKDNHEYEGAMTYNEIYHAFIHVRLPQDIEWVVD